MIAGATKLPVAVMRTYAMLYIDSKSALVTVYLYRLHLHTLRALILHKSNDIILACCVK